MLEGVQFHSEAQKGNQQDPEDKQPERQHLLGREGFGGAFAEDAAQRVCYPGANRPEVRAHGSAEKA